jgi:hypothetical protein
VDSCAQVVVDTVAQTVVQVDGLNFGYNASYFSILLSNGTTCVAVSPHDARAGVMPQAVLGA